jgi:rhamnosyl/mannosyltransferase
MISSDVPPYKGGISRIVGLLKDGLERSGHQVTLVHPNYRIRELKFSSIPFRQYGNSYDLIHLHGPTPFLSDLTLLTHCKHPIVYTHHAEVCWISRKISKIYRQFHRFLAEKAHAIIVHSYDYKRLFDGTNVAVIHMPCSFKYHKEFNIKQKANPFTVLFVGQFRPFKGIDILLKAASMLLDVNFVLVGDGYLKPKFMRMAEGLANVKFLGRVSDDALEKLYKQAHVVCLPSVNTTEAYGLVLIEGALYGCVPVASNLIGVRENVSRLQGCLFKPGSYQSLAGKIRMLSSQKESWLNLASKSKEAAHDYVSMHPIEYYVSRHEEIFASICSQKDG